MTIKIEHFSDILCIWAYIAQIRIDELKSEFGNNVKLKYHFIPVFGSVETQIASTWADKGGVVGYNKHVLNVSSNFDHIEVSKDIWLVNRPKTSISAHIFLKAIQIVQDERGMDANSVDLSWVEKYAWALRLAFFRDTLDVSNREVQLEIAANLDLPVEKIQEKIISGEAHAALELDSQLKAKYMISGSPTLIFNEGRQILYGNVGYRVIEANIRELLRQPEVQVSWC